jgi:N-acetylglucosaminyldiphosphoundecaprenol N-acetyl-beta-D-mannosaminyltransferase
LNETEILGARVTMQRFDEAIARLLVAAQAGVPFRAHFATVHSVVESSKDRGLRDVFRLATMVCTDGLPLVWLARLRGTPGERVCGPDTLLALADRGRELNLRHYFLGGAPGIPERLADNLKRRFPGLAVVGAESPPFRPISDQVDEQMIQRIRSSGAQVLWVGLGAPKQEFWAADHLDRLGSVVVLPIGAAFDFYSGRRRRAPRWMRRTGLEWMFRLLSEPRRLWRRYLVTNVTFVVLVGREEIRRRLVR